MGRQSDTAHLVRLGILFVIFVVAFLVIRSALIPAGFGVYGHYRAGALDDNMAVPMKYAGQTACADCHGDVVEARTHGPAGHPISCESCHGPLAAHAADPGTVAATKPDTRDNCLRCHDYRPARPVGFPQIMPAQHAPEGPCTDCHVPHAPKLS